MQKKSLVINNIYDEGTDKYYCRVLNMVRRKSEGQNICAKGCPCYVDKKCEYYTVYDGKSFNSPDEYKQYMDNLEREGMVPYFPEVKDLSERLKKAYEFAAYAHRKQKRKGTGIPYLIHLISAVEIAYELTDNEDIIIAVLLHDTIEDTDTTEEMIREQFGMHVAGLVAGESEDKRRDRPACDTWKERKMENIAHVKNGTHEMKIIALCDKLSNLRSMYDDVVKYGDALWQKFNQKNKYEHEWYYTCFLDIFKEFEGTEAYSEYKELLGKVWKEGVNNE